MPDTHAYSQAVEAAANPTQWAVERIVEDAQSLGVRSTDPTVSFYAHVTDGVSADFVKVSEVKASDLYAFSDAPIIEMLNAISKLRNRVDALRKISMADIDFEIETVNLWRDADKLKSFLGISSAHDEFIAAFRVLGFGENSMLDLKKLNALSMALSRVADQISLSDSTLDDVYSDLEIGGFDIDAPMAFACDE